MKVKNSLLLYHLLLTAFSVDSATEFAFLPRRRRGRNAFYLANGNEIAVTQCDF